MNWLIFFSSLPSKPVGNRVKVWRKLAKSGAVQFKGSVYILPADQERAEFLHWLAAEIAGMGGEAAFARVDRVDTVPDDEIIALFERRKGNDYRPLRAALDLFERNLENARQSGRAASLKRLSSRLDKLRKSFEENRRTDFFSSAAGRECQGSLERAEAALVSLLAPAAGSAPPPVIAPRASEDFLGKRWVTRGGPFVDRMACAWLIRRFVDPGAVFDFVGEDPSAAGPEAVGFDLTGGEFSHVGDLCTFEVLVRSFGLADAGLATIAEIVHDLDLEDDRHHRAEAAGVREILNGIRRSARDDADALERGIAVFELLYAAQRR